MASSLRHITSNLVTRSFRPTVVSAGSRFLSINRSFTTMPEHDINDQRPAITIACPKISSMWFKMKMSNEKRNLELKMPDDGMTVNLEDKPGLKLKDMRACAEHNTLMFPEKMISSDINDIKELEVKDGMLKVILPNEDEFKSISIILNAMANDIITGFHDITAKRSWSYYDMFSGRSILGKGLCRVIAMQPRINSFTIHKKETPEGLDIEMDIPGKVEMKLIAQGLLRVSWRRFTLEREDVTVFFDYDTLFIEAKTKCLHYITGIHLPEGIHIKHNMIRREMEDDVFYAFLPCGKMHDELKLIN